MKFKKTFALLLCIQILPIQAFSSDLNLSKISNLLSKQVMKYNSDPNIMATLKSRRQEDFKGYLSNIVCKGLSSNKPLQCNGRMSRVIKKCFKYDHHRFPKKLMIKGKRPKGAFSKSQAKVFLKNYRSCIESAMVMTSNEKVFANMERIKKEREAKSAMPKQEWFDLLESQGVWDHYVTKTCQTKKGLLCTRNLKKALVDCFTSNEAKLPERITKSGRPDAFDLLFGCAIPKLP